jgi:hypothetical protein
MNKRAKNEKGESSLNSVPGVGLKAFGKREDARFFVRRETIKSGVSLINKRVLKYDVVCS